MSSSDPIYFKDELPCSALRFVQTALDNMIFYDDNEKLLHAIDLGLPELLHEDNRVALKLVVSGSHKTRGRKPQHAKLKMIQTAQIIEKMCYWDGYGKPLYSNSVDEPAHNSNCAAVDVANELRTTYTNVRDTYVKAKKRLNGHGHLVSKFSFSKGRADRVGFELNQILVGEYTDEQCEIALNQVATKLGISIKEARGYVVKWR